MTATTEFQPVELVSGEATTTSRQVAMVFGKQHKVVLRAIDNIAEDIDNGLAQNSANPQMFTEEQFELEANGRMFR
jgi:phage regulator Rha-like protein